MTVTASLLDTTVSHRLHLGILPLDTLTKRQLHFYCRLEIENGSKLRISRHPSGRFSLLYHPDNQNQLHIKIYENARNYIPRRLSIPLITLNQIINTEGTQSTDYLASRTLYPTLFPGAAYPLTNRATGLRGRVIQANQAVRWPYVELVSKSDNQSVLARARGDDRGEFLLIVPPTAVPDVSLSKTVEFNLRMYARSTPVPFHSGSKDPFWDLPLEQIATVDAEDEVASGNVIPSDYVASSSLHSHTFELTRMSSGDFEFSPP